MEVRLVFKANGTVETTIMSTPFSPPPQAERGSPEQEPNTWDDVWDLCLAHGAAPALFSEPGSDRIKFSALFGALLDLQDVGLWNYPEIAQMHRFLKILLESLDPGPPNEYTPS